MHLDLIQSIAIAGDAAGANDDRAGAGDRIAWIIDGATDLGDPGLLGTRGGAAWIAMAADKAFVTADDAPLRAVVPQVFAAIAAGFEIARTKSPASAWELPSASFLAVRVAEEALECAWLGDCACYRLRDGGVERIGPRPSEKDLEAQLAASFFDEDPAALQKAAPVLAELRARRGRADRRILGVDVALASCVHHASVGCEAGDDIVLMTDGFAALFDRYDRGTEISLAASLHRDGLHGLSARLRTAEAEDAACTRWPRFKVSDDATAIWLRIAR